MILEQVSLWAETVQLEKCNSKIRTQDSPGRVTGILACLCGARASPCDLGTEVEGDSMPLPTSWHLQDSAC